MTKEVFVFVVCGSKEHIDTLHFSLEYLKKYSKKTIIIITDSNRNEVDVLHDTLVDINTPAHFNHHQASIYLKTGIHQFLPKGHLYCYLDTDVVALNSECDDIFGQYQFPITFAPDHCKVRSFSSYAVNCGCQDRCAEDRENFKKSLNNYDKNDKLSSSIAIKQRRKIEEKYNQIQQSFLAKFFYAIKYYLSFPKFWLDKNLYFDKNKRYWATKDGVVVKYELDVKSIAKEANLKYTLWFNKWKNKDGYNIFDLSCDHLIEQIQETFKVKVAESNWQHWNGGVFLFDDKSCDFLNAWHQKTMQIFNLPAWKTRDQGTLIATVWEFELQNHPTLSKEWNFIADFHNNQLVLSKETDSLSDDLFKTNYKPKFIHVFHEWGNDKWDVWNWVVSKKSAS